MEFIPEYRFGEPSRYQVFGSSLAYWDINPQCAETILIIHGFRGNHLGFRFLIPDLGERRIILADQPGYGDSTPMTERCHDLEGYVAVYSELLGHLGLDLGACHIIGHSFGSLIAVKLLKDYGRPHRGKLVLITATAVSPHKVEKPLVNAFIDSFHWVGRSLPAGLGRRFFNNRLYARFVVNTFSSTRDPEIREMLLRHQFGDMEFANDPKVVGETYDSSSVQGVTDLLPEQPQPALIIGGEEDRIAPLETQKSLAGAIPGSILAVIPGVGHLLPLEKPSELGRLIRDYLSSSCPQATLKPDCPAESHSGVSPKEVQRA